MHVNQLVLAEADVDRLVDHALAAHALIKPKLGHQVDGALLQHAGAHAIFHVSAALRFEHDAVDPLAIEQVREKESRGPRADDSDLAVHGVSFAALGPGAREFFKSRDAAMGQFREHCQRPRTEPSSVAHQALMTAITTDEGQRITRALAMLMFGLVAMGASMLILFGIYLVRPRLAGAGS